MVNECTAAVLRTQMGGNRCVVHWRQHVKRRSQRYWRQVEKWKKKGLPVSPNRSIEAVVGAMISKEVRGELHDEVIQSVVFDLMTTRRRGAVVLPDLVKDATRRFFREYQDKFRRVSLDQPLSDEEGSGSLLDLLTDDYAFSRRRERGGWQDSA